MNRRKMCRSLAAVVALTLAPTLAAWAAAAGPGNWPTKAALLAAARAGTFAGLPEVRVDVERETAPLTDSVLHILRQEYGVPTYETGIDGGPFNCRTSAALKVRGLLTIVTEANIDTLSDRPPAFARDRYDDVVQRQVRDEMLNAGLGLCATKVMGKAQPHPYAAALQKLAQEFNDATSEYVEAERERRRSAYAQEQAKQQAAQRAQADARARQEAEAQAAERQRIEAERARIEAENKRRRQQDKNRVAG